MMFAHENFVFMFFSLLFQSQPFGAALRQETSERSLHRASVARLGDPEGGARLWFLGVKKGEGG